MVPVKKGIGKKNFINITELVISAQTAKLK